MPVPDWLARSLATVIQSSRSTALQPLGWFLTLTGGMSLGLAFAGSTVLAGCAFGIFAFGSAYYLHVFDYFKKNDPNRLHSESFQTNRQLIERNLFGVSERGDVTLTVDSEPPERVAPQPQPRAVIRAPRNETDK